MTFYRRPTKLTKIMNGGMGWLASLGRTPSDTVTLEVKGRRTGAVRSTVVTSVEHEGVRYLVSPRGESEGVRNVRAAGGAGATRRGGRGERKAGRKKKKPGLSPALQRGRVEPRRRAVRKPRSARPDAR